MGMDVGGLPLCETLPVDMVSVAPKAMNRIVAKHHIARLPDIDINSVNRFKQRCR